MSATAPHAAPVAIGGVGGSGTRLVAAIAMALGHAMGPDLNAANDNLWFTLLFKHRGAVDLDDASFRALCDLFTVAMTGTRALDAGERALVQSLATRDCQQHPRDWLAGRAASLLAAAPHPAPARWGWKEPNTHLVLPQWRRARPDLRYVHVVRNGLDMAWSGNQNQRQLWGEWLLGRPVAETPRDSLAYWCAAHRRVQAIGAGMGADFLWLDYDALCRDPEPGLRALAGFFGVPEADALALRNLVQPPESTGRGRQQPLDGFDPADLDYLRSLGHLD